MHTKKRFILSEGKVKLNSFERMEKPSYFGAEMASVQVDFSWAMHTELQHTANQPVLANQITQTIYIHQYRNTLVLQLIDWAGWAGTDLQTVKQGRAKPRGYERTQAGGSLGLGDGEPQAQPTRFLSYQASNGKRTESMASSTCRYRTEGE